MHWKAQPVLCKTGPIIASSLIEFGKDDQITHTKYFALCQVPGSTQQSLRMVIKVDDHGQEEENISLDINAPDAPTQPSRVYHNSTYSPLFQSGYVLTLFIMDTMFHVGF